MSMEKCQIIIIGAGAAGLMCARDLIRAGNNITVLEARNRLGGRIHTVTDGKFPLPVEAGAEFVHGNLTLTKQLLKEAGIDYYEMEGDLWRSEQGQFVEQDDFIENSDTVIKKLKELQTDISIASFLDTFFKGPKYAELRQTLTNYVEGYDAADTTRASAFALLQELLGEENQQYRIKGGYQKLADHLANSCRQLGCIFQLETIVKELHWQKGSVKVVDQNRKMYEATKIVITTPLGVLQSSPGSIGHIVFSPAISHVDRAIQSLGYGPVIKTVLNFDEPIWNLQNQSKPHRKSAPAFVFSDASIPTWWTQLPLRNGMITGWLAGPKAVPFLNEADGSILEIALDSLSQIFRIPSSTLASRLIGTQVHNWSSDEFTRGAYSYETVDSKHARRTISEGIENTVFFAGEAFHEGAESATVEAALASGRKTAENIMSK